MSLSDGSGDIYHYAACLVSSRDEEGLYYEWGLGYNFSIDWEMSDAVRVQEWPASAQKASRANDNEQVSANTKASSKAVGTQRNWGKLRPTLGVQLDEPSDTQHEQ